MDKPIDWIEAALGALPSALAGMSVDDIRELSHRKAAIREQRKSWGTDAKR